MNKLIIEVTNETFNSKSEPDSFYGESFLSNPVIKEHAPLCKEYLIAIKDVLDISLSEYNRVYVQN
uniref:hypothetical protein n=1 Tax=Vibrio cholerae TaxID=666 RepID=UPI003F5862ED